MAMDESLLDLCTKTIHVVPIVDLSNRTETYGEPVEAVAYVYVSRMLIATSTADAPKMGKSATVVVTPAVVEDHHRIVMPGGNPADSDFYRKPTSIERFDDEDGEHSHSKIVL